MSTLLSLPGLFLSLVSVSLMALVMIPMYLAQGVYLALKAIVDGLAIVTVFFTGHTS